MIFASLEQFGEGANILQDTGEEELSVDQMYPMPGQAGSANSAERVVWTEETKLVMQLRKQARDASSKLVGKIMNSLDADVEMRIRLSPNFDEIITKRDARALWRLVEAICMGVAESAVSDGVIEKQRFQRLQQARGQSLEDYVTTFTEALKRLQLLKVKTEPVDTIYQFLLNLDPDTYGAVVSNWIARGEIPDTFEKAKDLVIKWRRAQTEVAGARSTRALTEALGTRSTQAVSESTMDPVAFPAATMKVARQCRINRGSTKCLYCDTFGHFAQECPILLKDKSPTAMYGEEDPEAGW